MEADNQENIEINSQPAVRAVESLMGAFQRLNSEVIKTNSLVSEQLAKTEKFRAANLQGASQLQAEMRAFLLSMKENTRVQNTIGQAVSTPSLDATIRNAEQLRQSREDQYLRTREARIELLNRKIELSSGAEREALQIKRQSLVVDGEEIKLARGQTNEYTRQKQILDGLVNARQEALAKQKEAEAAARRETTAQERIARSEEAAAKRREEIAQREAQRRDLLNRKIELSSGAERETLQIKRQSLRVSEEELKLARGEANEYVREKQILESLLQTQRERTVEQRRQLQLSQMQASATNREDIAARAGVGLSIARERVIGSGAADTFGIQTALTANFFIVTQLMSAMRFATAFVIDFDRALFNLQAITSSTDGTMESFRRTIEQVANSTKFTAVEVAQAAQVLGQAGFTAREVQQALGAVAQYASATGIQMSDAVDLMTSAISVFNMTATEATNVANTFTAAINNSKLTQQQLGLAFSYVANTANQSGIAFTELTATLAGLANAGIRSGSTIGTNLRALLVDLQSPSEELIDTLRTLGLTMYDIDLGANGLIGVIQNLRAAGFGAAEAFGTLETRSAAAFLALSGQADTLIDIQRALVGTQAAADASDTQMQSLANTLANFQSVTGTLALNTFEPVVRGLQELVESTNGALIALNELTAANPIAAAAVEVLGAALIGLGAAAFVQVIARITGFSASLGTMRTKMATAGASAAASAAQIQNFGRTLTLTSVLAGQTAGPLRTIWLLFRSMPGHILASNVAARLLAGTMVAMRGAFALLGGPVGIFITAATLLPVLMGNVSNRARELQQSLDQAATALDSSRAGFEENRNVIEGLSEEIDFLRRQEQRLRSSQDALQTKAAELVDTYGELGIDLNSLTATYDDVAAAVYRLRDAHIAEGLAAAQSVVSSARTLRDTRRESFLEGTVSQRLGPDRVSRLFPNRNIPGFQAFLEQFGNLQQAVSNGDSARISRLGTDVSDRYLNNLIRTLDDRFGSEAPNEVNELRQALVDLRSEIRGLTSSEQLVQTAERQQAVADRSTDDDVLALRRQADQLRNLFEAAQRATLQNRTFNRAAYESGDLDGAYGPVNPDLNSDPRLREELYRTQVGPIVAEIADFSRRLFGEGNTLDDLTRQALQRLQVESDLALDPAEFAASLSDLSEESIEASQAVVRIMLTALRNQVQAQIENLNQARNFEELETAAGRLDAALDNYAAARLRQAYLSLGFTDTQIAAGIDTSQFSPIQREELSAANSDISEFRNTRNERFESRRESVASNMRNERIGAIGREIRNLERSLRSALQDRPRGAGRTTLDEVLVQQLAIIDRLEELERQRLQIEAQDRNLSVETVASRERDITDDFEARRSDALRGYEDEFRDGAARSFREAIGDLFEVLSEEYMSETAREGQTFATAFRDTMLAAVEQTNRGFQKFFYDVATGAASVGEAFREMAYSILDSMLQVLTNKIAEQFTSMLLDFAFAAFGAPGAKQSVPITGGSFSFWQGGQIPGVKNAYQGMFATSTRDSMLINAAPGEYLLRQQAVRAIGKDTLDEINALGNRTISKSAAQMPVMPLMPKQENTTNVWLVTEDQAPPMGPNDVIAIVTRDGMTGGPIKRLIKSVTQGAV